MSGDLLHADTLPVSFPEGYEEGSEVFAVLGGLDERLSLRLQRSWDPRRSCTIVMTEAKESYSNRRIL